MFKNKISKISFDELKVLEEKIDNNPDIFYVKLNGLDIKYKNDYLLAMETLFKFPRKCEGIWDRFDDWIRDLEWIKQKQIVLSIVNSDRLLENDPKWRNFAIGDFDDFILSYWDTDVVNQTVRDETGCDEKRHFDVYLVD